MRILSAFCCLLYATLTDASGIIVEGPEGRNVSFRCSHKVAWKNKKYLCRHPCKTTKDVLVTVESGKRAESGRITLVDLGDGSFTVTFSQLQLSDSQSYYCGVDRPGFDTYTSVQLAVKKAASHKTTVLPEVFPPSLYQNVTNATRVTTDRGPSTPTSAWTASDFSEGGGQDVSRGPVVYAALGGVALILILILATHFRKCREISKPQPHVCTNSTDLCDAYEKEMSCVYENIDDGMRYVERFSESTPVSIDQYASAECSSMPPHIYGNIEGSTCSAADDKNDNDAASDIYINPLPSLIYENTGVSSNTTEATGCRNTKDCAGDETPPLSGSCSDARC